MMGQNVTVYPYCRVLKESETKEEKKT